MTCTAFMRSGKNSIFQIHQNLNWMIGLKWTNVHPVWMCLNYCVNSFETNGIRIHGLKPRIWMPLVLNELMGNMLV